MQKWPRQDFFISVTTTKKMSLICSGYQTYLGSAEWKIQYWDKGNVYKVSTCVRHPWHCLKHVQHKPEQKVGGAQPLGKHIMATVAKYMSERDLTALALTCREFRGLSQRALLKNVYLNLNTPCVIHQLMTTLNDQMLLGQFHIGLETFVKNIHLTLADGILDPLVPKGVFYHLANVFPHLTSLKSFTMSSHIWNPSDWMCDFANILAPALPRGLERVVFYAVDVSQANSSAMWTDLIICQDGVIAQRPSEVCLMMTMPESDELWVTWFAHMSNVPCITFVTGFELWEEMSAEQTLPVWTSQSSKELCRVEIWSCVEHVQFTQDFHLGRVWVEQTDPPSRVKYSMVRGLSGHWSLQDEGEVMWSGPHAELLKCICYWSKQTDLLLSHVLQLFTWFIPLSAWNDILTVGLSLSIRFINDRLQEVGHFSLNAEADRVRNAFNIQGWTLSRAHTFWW